MTKRASNKGSTFLENLLVDDFGAFLKFWPCFSSFLVASKANTLIFCSNMTS